MIETIEYKGSVYPKFQEEGNAAKFALPFAKEVCKGYGYDIGCNRPEWSLPGSILVDPVLNEYSATSLPFQEADYIFSSHCLEHVTDWVRVLDYWYGRLKPGGVLFLYLPDFSQVYWRGWHNIKHCNMFTPEILKGYFNDQPDKWCNLFVSGIDLNNSFMLMVNKNINDQTL